MTTTVDSFLAGVKRRITFPANQALLTDNEILEMADDANRETMTPLLMSVNQNYLAVEQQEPIVANQAEYRIPYRSVGRGLRDIKLIRDNNRSNIRDVTLVALEDAHIYAASGHSTSFYFLGDKIVLVPTPVSASDSILFYYNMQLSQLVKTSDAAKVTSISGNDVTVSSLPGTMTAGVTVDFIQGKSGCSILEFDVGITNAAGLTLSFTAGDVPTELAVGDYIALAGESPVLQIPDECQPYLEILTGQHILTAIGDMEGLAALDKQATESERAVKMMLTPRIEGETTKIVNRHGLLRGKGYSYWRARGGYYF